MATPFLSSMGSAADPFDLPAGTHGQRVAAPALQGELALAERRLAQLTSELAFDTGLVLQSFAQNRVRLAVGAAFDPLLSDVITWPWIDRVVRRNGALVMGTPEGESDVAAEGRRRLWAMGVGSLVCVPLASHDLNSGALVLTGRHAVRAWSAVSLPSVLASADAIRQHLALDTPAPTSAESNADTSAARRGGTRRLPATVRSGDADIVGVSPAWRYVMFRVDQVAATQATVLLLGETGTGKELVARAIHQRSARAAGRFVALNSSALPAPLIESELFGHERGAYTGAHTAQPGRFELAHRGTLFLDEIGELPVELQPKLLRVLQEGQFDRLGSTQTLDVDVRVIAATNRDLLEETRQGRFRQDLYYRLNVFPITLPSLRERRDDIPLLAAHLATRFAKLLRKPIAELPSAVIERLQDHDWPGNIRELENVIQRAIIMSTDGVLSLREIQLTRNPSTPTSGGTTLAEVEHDHILRILGLTGWRIEGSSGAARLLGLKPSTLRSRLRKLGIQRGL